MLGFDSLIAYYQCDTVHLCYPLSLQIPFLILPVHISLMLQIYRNCQWKRFTGLLTPDGPKGCFLWHSAQATYSVSQIGIPSFFPWKTVPWSKRSHCLGIFLNFMPKISSLFKLLCKVFIGNC